MAAFASVSHATMTRIGARAGCALLSHEFKPRLFDLWFQDDPILVARRQAGEPQIPAGVRSNGDFLAGPDFIAIRPVVRDVAGTWHAVRDLDMIPA